MAEIVNLKRAKKAKARRAAEDKANSNRVRFGVPKAERERARALREKDEHDIESRKLDGENG